MSPSTEYCSVQLQCIIDCEPKAPNAHINGARANPSVRKYLEQNFVTVVNKRDGSYQDQDVAMIFEWCTSI